MAPSWIVPPLPYSTPSCLANISAKKSSEGTSISLVICSIVGEETLASSWAEAGVRRVRVAAVTWMCEPRIVSATSWAVNVAGS